MLNSLGLTFPSHPPQLETCSNSLSSLPPRPPPSFTPGSFPASHRALLSSTLSSDSVGNGKESLDLSKDSGPKDLPSLGPLRAGSTWLGHQRSGRDSYSVRVTIITVDAAKSTLSGYLTIRGLAKELKELTTFFDGEIVGLGPGSGSGLLPSVRGSLYSDKTKQNQGVGFLTNKWGAGEAEDLKHWSRFPAFLPLRPRPHPTTPGHSNADLQPKDNTSVDGNPESSARSPHHASHISSVPSYAHYRYDPLKPGGKTIFMRWKERFVVPHHRLRDVRGASFDGFYYVSISFERNEPKPHAPTSPRPRRNSKAASQSPPPAIRATSPPARSSSVVSSERVQPISNPSGPTPVSSPTHRRARTFSYAAAVLRSTSNNTTPAHSTAELPTLAPSSPSATSTIPSPINIPTVGQASPEESGEHLPKVEDSSPPPPAPIRVPYSPSQDEFPLPSSGSPPPATGSPPLLMGSRGLTGRRRVSNTTELPTLSTVIEPMETGPSAPFGDRGKSTQALLKDTSPWGQATLTGFYFHTLSDPFQELLLYYEGNRCAGSSTEGCPSNEGYKMA